MKSHKTTKKTVRILFIIVISTFAAFLLIKEISQKNYLKEENNKLLSKIKSLELQNKNYKRKIHLIQNDAKFKEKILREEFGMIKEGEKIFKFQE